MAELYLEVTEDRSGNYYHLCLYPRFVKPAAEANKNCGIGQVECPDCYDDDEKTYNGFRVFSQGGSHRDNDDKRTLYAWAYHFHDAEVTTENVGRMAKLLAKIARGMDKAAEEHGSPADFADYCGRIARALKAKGFVRSVSNSHDYPYRQMSIAEGIDYVRWCERQYIEAGKEHAA